MRQEDVHNGDKSYSITQNVILISVKACLTFVSNKSTSLQTIVIFQLFILSGKVYNIVLSVVLQKFPVCHRECVNDCSFLCLQTWNYSQCASPKTNHLTAEEIFRTPIIYDQ